MAGSHRAQRAAARASRVPRWAIALAVVAALVPAAWFTGQRVLDPPPSAHDGSGTDLPIPPVSPRPTGAPAATPSAPSTAPPTAAVPLPAVAPDSPRRLQSATIIDTGFDAAVSALQPASTSEVARLGSRGTPASPGTDTVVVVGKVLATGDGALGHLPALVVGSVVTLRTDSGTLTYTVSGSTLRPASGLAGDPLVTGRVPGRLVLVGIRYAASGDRLPDALVVTAQLSGAVTS